MLVDPWGNVVSERATGAGFVVGEVDASRIEDVRRKLPALEHRRLAAARDVR
jgi:nitrilase